MADPNQIQKLVNDAKSTMREAIAWVTLPKVHSMHTRNSENRNQQQHV
jgi:hypothetical protein